MKWEPYNKDPSLLCGVPDDPQKGYQIVVLHDLDPHRDECEVHLCDDLEHEAFVERVAAGLNLLERLQHLVGNPVFAIETNLEPLKKRIEYAVRDHVSPLQAVEEPFAIIDEIQASLEKIKAALAAKGK